MLRRRFFVFCFEAESRTLELEDVVVAPTAADAVVEFFRMYGLGIPPLPLGVELPEISADSFVQVWSVSVPRIGLHVRIKERIWTGLEKDKAVSDCGELLN